MTELNDGENSLPEKDPDKRRDLRTPLIVLKVKLDDGNKAFFGYAKNISRSGLFIATVNPKEPGSTFHIEIPLPDPINRSVQCEAEVIWKRHYTRGGPYEPGMGLKFNGMPDHMAELIDLWAQSATD
ncbi:MAG: pilus assembly protein PilZ [Desulfuromonadales bacterium]|nr:pilus assembly protein PilZ [Desulfuromonadales bacterium]NIS42080.1 pilus assembly protein PilZ [Desulfuromonadales bacterium]